MFVLLPHLAAVVVKPLRIDGLVFSEECLSNRTPPFYFCFLPTVEAVAVPIKHQFCIGLASRHCTRSVFAFHVPRENETRLISSKTAPTTQMPRRLTSERSEEK